MLSSPNLTTSCCHWLKVASYFPVTTRPFSSYVQQICRPRIITRSGAPAGRPLQPSTAGWPWECSQRAPLCSESDPSWPSGRRSWMHTRQWACGWAWRRTGRSRSPPWWLVWRGGSCSRCAWWREQSCRWPERTFTSHVHWSTKGATNAHHNNVILAGVFMGAISDVCL